LFVRRGDRGFVFAAPHTDDVLAEHLFFLRFLVGALFAATLLEGRVDGRFRRRLGVFRPGLIGLVFGHVVVQGRGTGHFSGGWKRLCRWRLPRLSGAGRGWCWGFWQRHGIVRRCVGRIPFHSGMTGCFGEFGVVGADRLPEFNIAPMRARARA